MLPLGKWSQLILPEQGHSVRNKEKGSVIAQITHWYHNYMDRAKAPGHILMAIIRLICLFKISLDCSL